MQNVIAILSGETQKARSPGRCPKGEKLPKKKQYSISKYALVFFEFVEVAENLQKQKSIFGKY